MTLTLYINHQAVKVIYVDIDEATTPEERLELINNNCEVLKNKYYLSIALAHNEYQIWANIKSKLN